MTRREVIFHYYSGDVVREGDVVFTGNVTNKKKRVVGIVRTIFQPRAKAAEAFGCFETGGVLIEEKWGRKTSLLLMTPPDGADWEDLELIKRKRKRER